MINRFCLLNNRCLLEVRNEWRRQCIVWTKYMDLNDTGGAVHASTAVTVLSVIPGKNPDTVLLPVVSTSSYTIEICLTQCTLWNKSHTSLTRFHIPTRVHVLRFQAANFIHCTLLPSFLPYLLTYLLHGAEFFWEANRVSARQEILHTLWNPKVHYCIHKCPPLVPILSQLDPVHTPTFHFLKIHLNIILTSTPGSPNRSLSLRFPHQTLHMPLLSLMRATCPAHLILLDFITREILVQIIKILIINRYNSRT